MLERTAMDHIEARTWRHAWIAYVWPVLRYGIAIAIVSSVDFLPWWITALLAARLAYVLAYLRTVKIILNDKGIWKQFGILPWSSGSQGVKWRDLDQAEIYFGFLPWLTNAHQVRVGHRYTKSAEIVIPDVWDARGLTDAINGEHERLARSGALQ